MTDTPEQIPPELAAEFAAVEAEANQVLGREPSTSVQEVPPEQANVGVPKSARERVEEVMRQHTVETVNWLPGSLPPSVLPLADLRERLQLCRESGVEEYRDGPIVIRFSSDLLRAQRELLSPMPQQPAERW